MHLSLSSLVLGCFLAIALQACAAPIRQPSTSPVHTDSTTTTSTTTTTTTTTDGNKIDLGQNLKHFPYSVAGPTPPSLYRSGQVLDSCIQSNSYAISFDDGPGQLTDELLDFLDEQQIKVTFFMNGDNWNCIYRPESQRLLKRAFNSQHQIAAHPWSHNDFELLTDDEIREEMRKVEAAFRNILGVVPRYMRPPYGDHSKRVQRIMEEMGYLIILWDVDRLQDDGSLSTTLSAYDNNNSNGEDDDQVEDGQEDEQVQDQVADDQDTQGSQASSSPSSLSEKGGDDGDDDDDMYSFDNDEFENERREQQERESKMTGDPSSSSQEQQQQQEQQEQQQRQVVLDSLRSSSFSQKTSHTHRVDSTLLSSKWAEAVRGVPSATPLERETMVMGGIYQEATSTWAVEYVQSLGYRIMTVGSCMGEVDPRLWYKEIVEPTDPYLLPRSCYF